MIVLQFRTNVKIDHKFYKLDLDYTKDDIFYYYGRFVTSIPENIISLINSNICIYIEKNILTRESSNKDEGPN